MISAILGGMAIFGLLIAGFQDPRTLDERCRAELLDIAIQIEQLQDQSKKAESLRIVGNALYALGDLSHGKDLMRKGIAIDSKHKCSDIIHDSMLSNDIAIDLARINHNSRTVGEAFDRSLGLLAEFQKEHAIEKDAYLKNVDTVRELDCLEGIAVGFECVGRHDKAEEIVQRAISLCRKIDDLEFRNRCRESIAATCRKIGDQKQAHGQIEEICREIESSKNDSVNRAIIDNLVVSLFLAGDAEPLVQVADRLQSTKGFDYLLLENLPDELRMRYPTLALDDKMERVTDQLIAFYQKLSQSKVIDEPRRFRIALGLARFLAWEKKSKAAIDLVHRYDHLDGCDDARAETFLVLSETLDSLERSRRRDSRT